VQEQVDWGERSDGLTTSEREELRRLRRQTRDLDAEREFPKRAVTFFVREVRRG
jgi:transposase